MSTKKLSHFFTVQKFLKKLTKKSDWIFLIYNKSQFLSAVKVIGSWSRHSLLTQNAFWNLPRNISTMKSNSNSVLLLISTNTFLLFNSRPVLLPVSGLSKTYLFEIGWPVTPVTKYLSKSRFVPLFLNITSPPLVHWLILVFATQKNQSDFDTTLRRRLL